MTTHVFPSHGPTGPKGPTLLRRVLMGALGATLLAACSGKSVDEVLEAGSGDPAAAGVSSAERRANGTVYVSFKGLQGSSGYAILEKEKAAEEPKAAKLLAFFGLQSQDKAEKERREIARVQHVAGKGVYEIETSHIPFGEQFCFSVKATLKDGKDVELGQERCLLNDQNWRWKGVAGVSADGMGRVVVSWDRLPVGGASYDLLRKYPEKEEAKTLSSFGNVVDSGRGVDEASDDIFPRCYAVRIKHPLLSKKDENAKEMCLTLATWKEQRDKTVDLEPPLFTGIKSIEVTRNEGLVAKAASAVGLNAGVTVLLSWDPAKDNMTPDRRMAYKIFRSETSFGFDFATPLAETKAGELSYKDTSISKGATYFYLVRAVDDRGNLDQNLNQKKLPLDLEPPTFAGVVAATTKRIGGGVRVVLAWNTAQDDQTAPQGIVYEIYRSQSENNFDSQPLSKVSGITSFEDGSTERNQIYYYKVLAVDREGNRDKNTKTVTANTGETPPRFEGVREVKLFNQTGRLLWDPAEDDESPPNAIFYRIYRRDENQEFNFKSPIVQTSPGVLQFEDASVDPNKSYYYVVRAVDEQGFENTNTAEKQMAANRAPTLGTQPGTGNAPIVTWDKSQNCPRVVWPAATDDSTAPSKIKYRIYRSASASVTTFEEVEGRTRWLDDASCGQDRELVYTIAAEDTDRRVSTRSSPGRLPQNQPPVAPIVTQKSIVNGTQVLLKWNTAYDPTDPNIPDDRTADARLRFRVFRFPKHTGTGPAPTRNFTAPSSLAANLSEGIREWVDPSGASGQTEYAWVIRSVDEYDIESVNTNEVSLDSNLPPTFSGLTTVTPSGLRSVNMTWTLASDDRTPSNLITYRIYQVEVPPGTPTGSDPANPIPAQFIDQLFASQPVEQILGQVTTLTRSIPDPNKMYIFGIRAFDAQGAGDENRRAVGVPANNPPTFGGLESATVIAGGSVRLAWLTGTDDKDPSNQILYRVYRYKSSNATESAATVRTLGTLHRTSSAGATSIEDDAVDPAANTHYLVRAVDGDQAEDVNTRVVTVLKDSVAPIFLGIKSATMDAGGTRITLVWDPASDNRTQAAGIKYRVFESLEPGLTDLLASTPIADLTNGQVTFSRTPPTSAKYYYLVRAIDEAGNADSNEAVKFTVDEVPPTFAGLIAGYPITGNSAQVFWTGVPNDDINKIKIYKAEDLVNPVAAVNVRDLQGNWVNSYLITGLTNATSYAFIARASDLYGNEEQNTVAKEITTLAEQSPTFAGLQGAEAVEGIPGLNSIRLSWSPAANATHYRIFRISGTSERGETFDFNYESCKNVWGAAASPGCIEVEATGTSAYEVSGLVKNSLYSFVVRAVNKDGDSVLGEELNRVIRTAKTIDEVAPTFAGASSVVPAPGSSGMNTVVVSWDPPKADGVYDGFRVVYKQVAAPATTFSLPPDLSTDPQLGVVTVADPGTREINVGSLTYNTRYCFTVVTKYNPLPAVRSVPNTTTGFQCVAPVPQPPVFAGVKSTVVKGAGGLAFSQATVSWDAAEGSFTSYDVSWSKTNDYVSDSNPGSFFGGSNTTAVGTRSTGSLTITNLEANTTYYLRVRAKFQMAGPPAINLTAGGDVVAQTVTTPAVPSGDGILSATQVGDDQIELKWGAPTNDGLYNRYIVFRATGPTAETDVQNQAAANAGASPPYVGPVHMTVLDNAGVPYDRRVIMDTGLAADTRYCYLVRAAFQSAQGFIGSSNTIVKCVEIQIKPPQFFGVTRVRTPATASGFSSLVAEWEPASGNFTRYEYAYGLDPGSLSNWIAVAGAASTTTVTIGSLESNSTYYVKVRAIYVKGAGTYASGETAMETGITTPKAPQHGGLEPIEFLQNPGEVRLRWTVPNSDAEIGGLYDRYLLFRLTGTGGGAQIFSTIDTLMADGVISSTEVTAPSNGISELDKTLTSRDYIGSGKLPENVESCFLVRAAFRQGTNFVMSPNQTVRCVTPTASAPMFGGIATLQNIPLSVNGFTQLKATWTKAVGNFTRYEIAVADQPNSQSWSPVSFRSTNANTETATFTHLDVDLPQNNNRLIAFKRYYARVRAIYVGAGNAIYSAGESGELSQVLSPDRPTEDGLKSVAVDKIAGKAPAARLVINGSAGGLWDKVYVFRSTNLDESAARADVIARSTVNALETGFTGTQLAILNRPSATSTSDITYDDTTATQGQWNCYIARAAYATAPWFLGSKGAQTPICSQPLFNPINFSGAAASGTRICQQQANPANPEPCDLNARWAYSGSSRVELKLASVPQGDIDFFDVYYGYSPNADEILARGVYQTILKGDVTYDSNPDDDVLLVGGDPANVLPAGTLHFLVRARCVGCTFVDSNKNVSNAIAAQRPWLAVDVRFQAAQGANFAPAIAGPGRFEDSANYGVFTANGTAALNGTDDYLKATHPGTFAPRPGTTFALKYNLTSTGDKQNVDGTAVFAADSSPRAAYFDNVSGSYIYRDGSLFGLSGASTVFDRRSGKCMWIGGYTGSARDYGDWPVREWSHNWGDNRGDYARRFQTWDGQNFAEVFERNLATGSPLPRSLPVLAYNPARDTVWLFGGLDQGTPQTLRADTWEWDGRAWTRLDAGPSAPQTATGQIGRYGSGVMAFDPFRNEMVMVGGKFGVPDSGWPDQNFSQSRRMAEAADSTVDVLTNKVRTDAMAHYTFDAATQSFTWKRTVNLPSGLPKGYPAALVTVPSDKNTSDGVDAKGLYYFSVTWSGWDSVWRNNVWHYDGTSWSELANTTIPDNTPHSNLMAAYDEVKDRIIITFGRGNNPENRRIWEFNPARAKAGQGQDSYTQRYLTTAPPTFSGMPCFDFERREIVDHGGYPVSDHGINARTTVRERLPQDVFVYSLATDTWRRASPAFDHTGRANANTPYAERKGVFAQGGYFLSGFNGQWEDWMASFSSWLFTDGAWKRLFDTDITRKWQANAHPAGWNQNTFGFNSGLPMVDPSDSKEKIYLIDNSSWSDSNAATGRGRPFRLREFDGQGWNAYTMNVSDITFPEHRCPNVLGNSDANWHYRFDNGINFSQIETTWGIFLKGPSFRANIPWDPNSGTTNCSAGRTWRSMRSPFLVAAKESGSWRVRELKAPGMGLPTDPFKWCATVGTSPSNPDLSSTFKEWPPVMVWDDANQRVLLVGARNSNAWTSFQRDIQAIKRREDPDPSKRCFFVENISAPFPNSSWTSLDSHAQHFDQPLWDPARGKLMVLSTTWTPNSQGTRYDSVGLNGFLWELDVKTASATTPGQWRFRPLPDEFKGWTVFNGNSIRFAQPLPGKPGEFLLMADRELHDKDRAMSNSYILKVTDTAISLKPTVPRFGLTLGADRTSGYLSVPGDPGDADGTLGTQTLYSGRRRIATNITGEHTLFVVFENNTYSVYMDGNATPLVSNAAWAGASGEGIYLQDFILGARWGQYIRSRDYRFRQFMGIGNTRVEVDWVRMFDKPLSTSEMGWWHAQEDDPQ